MRIFIKTIILSTILSFSITTVHAWGGASGDMDRLLSYAAQKKKQQAINAKKRMQLAQRLQAGSKNSKKVPVRKVKLK